MPLVRARMFVCECANVRMCECVCIQPFKTEVLSNITTKTLRLNYVSRSNSRAYIDVLHFKKIEQMYEYV